MRLKAGIYEYKLPKGVVHYSSADLIIKNICWRMCHVTAKVILAMQKENPAIVGIPEYLSIMTSGKNKYLLVYPKPAKSWKLQLRVLKEHVL